MNEVERIHGELVALRELVAQAQSPSDLNAFDVLAAKSLLLAAASHFERQLCDGIEKAASETGAGAPIVNFISKQALERKFHTLFDWKKSNINSFLGLFGPEAKKVLDDEIQSDELLLAAVRDFIFIGGQRNLMVHNNFASFTLESSMREIWAKFENASRFANWFPMKLTELCTKKPE